VEGVKKEEGRGQKVDFKKKRKKKEKQPERNLQRILATEVRESREEKLQSKRERKLLEKDQQAYCKATGPESAPTNRS
jgi:hypothetical protein